MPRTTSSKRTSPPRSRATASARLETTERTVLAGLAHDAELARDEALRAPDLGRLTAVQFEWAAEQWVRAAQAWSGLWSALLDAQAKGWRDTEACTLAALEPWLVAARRPLPTDAAFEGPNELSPRALMERSMTAWLVIGRACMGALEHDLEAERAKPPRVAAA